MKKLVLTLAATLVSVAVFAQGTVAFSNSALYRHSSGTEGDTLRTAVPTTAGLITYGLFFGIGTSTSLQLLPQLGVNSTTGAGLIASPADNVTPLSLVAIPGAPPDSGNVWVQIRGWSSSYGTDWMAAMAGAQVGDGYFGQTDIRNIGPLGATTGPAVPLWQSATGTNPQRFGPMTLLTGVIPEPGTMTLAGLGLAALLIFRRRK